MEIISKLTVYFDEPFWVGVFERTYDGRYEVSKVVFGAEPKDYDVYDFILKKLNHLKYTCSISADKQINKKINPKRMKRKINEELKNQGVGTKAQIAMKLQHETNKIEHKKRSKEMKEEENRRKFELKQQKKKEKHRGH